MTFLNDSEKAAIAFFNCQLTANKFSDYHLNRIFLVDINDFLYFQIRDAILLTQNSQTDSILTNQTLAIVEEDTANQNISTTVVRGATTYTTTYGNRTKTVKKVLPWNKRISNYYRSINALIDLLKEVPYG